MPRTRRLTPKVNTYVLYEDKDRVCLVTGFDKPTEQKKTGDMLQSFILPRNIHPYEALATKQDKIVCGTCPLKSGNGCNVAYMLPRNLSVLWKKYKRGEIPQLVDGSLIAGRKFRFGVYGDPVYLPLELVRTIVELSSGWTGYTHQWKNKKYRAYRDYFQASTSPSDNWLAKELGWSTFQISAEQVAGSVACPASDESKARRAALGLKLIDCATCLLCSGRLRKAPSGELKPKLAKDVYINVHGSAKNKASTTLGLPILRKPDGQRVVYLND